MCTSHTTRESKMRAIDPVHISLVNMIMMLNDVTVCTNRKCRRCPYVEKKGGLFVVCLDDGVKTCLIRRNGSITFEGYCTRDVICH